MQVLEQVQLVGSLLSNEPPTAFGMCNCAYEGTFNIKYSASKGGLNSKCNV